MLLVLITDSDVFFNPCFMDWNDKVNLGCILLYLLSKETEPMFDDWWTLFRWCTERKSSQKETREIHLCGDQGCLIRKMRDGIIFTKYPFITRFIHTQGKRMVIINYFSAY